MKTEHFEIECLYPGIKDKPDYWDAWVTKLSEQAAKDIRNSIYRAISNKTIIVKAVRIVKVTRETF